MSNKSKTMIEVNDVTMRFHMNLDKILSLKEFVTRKLSGKLAYQDFTALEHVSFTVQRGETFGLIGRNGAGKSTMLKVISGILKPTEGSVVCKGNIVPMLELGSGFDMDLNGRENIFLNGAILGYSEEFLKEKYEEIVAFSELEQFIETPIGLIKLDIEGNELAAIHGAEQTIRRCRPLLCISIYHHPQDFFEIKPFIESLKLRYRFMVRKLVFHDLVTEVSLLGYCEEGGLSR